VTPEQKEAAFRADLEALLKRHGAEMTITDDGKPWGLHSAVVVITMLADAPDLPYVEFEL
jgi:hypothetical protein